MMEVRDKRQSVKVLKFKKKFSIQARLKSKRELSGQNASWTVKTRVERSTREVNGLNMSWSLLILFLPTHSLPKRMTFQLQWTNMT